MIKMRRFGLGGFCKRAIAFMVMLCLLLSDMVVFKVEAATFSYKWIGSASSSGSFKFSDGTTDSAGYGYSISGIGKVFCINQGSEIYNNDNYTDKGSAKFKSEGKNDFSYDAVIAKISYYWVSNKDDDFARSLVQALIWQTMDKGYTSKSALENIIKQSKTKDADKLFKEIFEVDDEISATLTTYKSSNYGSTQRMALLSAKAIEDNTQFSFATYKRSMTYRQILSLHKTDFDNNPVANVVYEIKLSEGFDRMISLSMQKGVLLKANDVNDLAKGFAEVLERDAEGNATGSKVTKSADQLRDMYPGNVIYLKTDANGDIRFRVAFRTESKTYAYGKYKKDGKWIYVETYKQMEKLSDNTDSSVMKDGHTYYYWMKKAHSDSGDESGWAGFKDRARNNAHGKNRMDADGEIISDKLSDLRNEYENVSTYFGISELKGVYGNTYFDNTLSINPSLDGNYKWVNIKKNESSISVDGAVAESNKKNVNYNTIGNYNGKSGGTYTNSDYVDASNNSWLSIAKQENNENSYSVDGARVTMIGLNGRQNIVNAYYKYGVGAVSQNKSYDREFCLHKIDEDGAPIANAKFDLKVDLLKYASELKSVYVNDKVIYLDDKEIFVNDKKVDVNDESDGEKNKKVVISDESVDENVKLDGSIFELQTMSDKNGDIKVRLEFEKKYDNYSYGYGKYFDYNTFKYVDVVSAGSYVNLSSAAKSGIAQVVNNAYINKMFSYYDDKTFDINGGMAKANEAIDNDFDGFLKVFAEEKIKVSIKEVDVVGKDYYAINKNYADYRDCNLADKQMVEIVDKHKCFSTKIIKVGPDGVKKLDGAVFEIYEDADFKIPAKLYDKNGKLINNDGKAIAYTTKDGELVTDYLRCSIDEYYLKEVKAPLGYVSIYEDSNKDNDVLKIKCDGSKIADTKYMIDETVNVEVKNQGITIRFEKRDKETKKYVEGAKIEVKDKDGKVVSTFDSVIGGNEFEGVFASGEEYTFHEVKAPNGYDDANDIKIIVKATDKIQVVTMYDEKISIVKTSKRVREKEDDGGGEDIITPKTGIFIDDCRAVTKAEISKKVPSKDMNMYVGTFAFMCNMIVYLYNVYGGMFVLIGMLLSLCVFAINRRFKGKTYENQ
ncbi:collagen binding domain-containing protein [uncultured Eubacterium sp.]|uniref:MSCRAMM family protein n=1 Tax=uncultured Eubacterium sp. TaxID=165185 RepID=UPI0025922500|nr:SpaA isopeptide-forming pilin-related protein [uncultured Eubacterium sp.]